MIRTSYVGVFAIIASSALSGCKWEGDSPSSAAAQPGAVTIQAAPNAVPTLAGTPAMSIKAGTTYRFQPQATDVDSDALAFSATGLPAWITLNSQTGEITGTPSEEDVGSTADILLSVSDGEDSASLPAFRITITSSLPPPAPPPAATNRAPTISGTPGNSITAMRAYSFAPTASDPDGQTLSFSIANRPAWASFSTTTGRISGTPSTAQARSYNNIVISVSDGALSASLPPFTITVNAPANRAPTISGSPAANVSVGAAYSFTPTGADPDGQTLTFSIANKPSWATFSTSTGRISGTPAGNNVGTTSGIVITATDGALSASLAAFSITVNAAPNTAPVILGTPATGVSAGSAYGFAPTASDADGNALAFSISGKPAWATFSTASGALTGTPTAAQAGLYTGIVITVSDGTNSTSLPAFAINVNSAPSTGTATLSWSAPTQNTDGSLLTDLAGYRVYHGTSSTSLTDVVDVPGTSALGYTWNQLASGTHYFAVAAYTASGVESAMSPVGSKAIP